MTDGVSERAVVIAGSAADGVAAVEQAFDAVTDCRVTSESSESLLEERVSDADALVVLDDPPAHDAIGTYRRVRAAEQTLPVLLVGEDTAPERVEQALKAGVTDYLPDWSEERAAELDARVSAHVERPMRDGTAQAGRWEAFAATLEHDAKNPLNVVTGRLELLDIDETHSGAVTRSVRRVESLLGEFSTVASAVRADGAAESVDLGEVANEVWRDVGGAVERLTVADAATVQADPDCLGLVLERLLENVLVHTDGAAVTVGSSTDGFYVADDGPGLPEADDRLFEQGYGTAREGEGYGLFVAATAAAAHGWDITAGPSADGGARFDVRPR